MGWLGGALALIGFILGIWGLNFQTYVLDADGSIGEINNVGLLFDRLVLCLVAAAIFLAGMILIGAAHVAHAVRARGQASNRVDLTTFDPSAPPAADPTA